nr:hypothetical protein [Tanacetum cinerariifolium]
VPPPAADLYLSPKKDLSWTSLPEFVDDIVTDYNRPSPAVVSTSVEDQNKETSTFKDVASPNPPKRFVKFVKPKDSQPESKSKEQETPKKSQVKYPEQNRHSNKRPKGNQRNWNNLKSYQLGPEFVLHKKSCFNYGDFSHLANDCRRRVQRETNRSQNHSYKSSTYRSDGHRPNGAHMRPPHRSSSPRTNRDSMRPSFRPVDHRPHGPSMNPWRPIMNVKNPYRALWVPTVNSSQNNIDDKGYWDSGCSRHMTGNISYLSDFEPFNGGYVSFAQGGCNITGRGTIKIECIVLGRNFKLLDDTNILLRTPRQHNMYSIDLNNIVPHKDLTCLVAKASADECILWHRRLGYLNVKTMNKLVRHNLVRVLPTKSFDNDHTCTACLKGKQHKASFVTDDFSRFTWTFFLRTKDETSDILKKFITEIENLKDYKVKIIRCDNGGEFRNKEMNDFCSQKGIKREFSNARTPQQNGVAERRNRTLIEAARTMLADAKLPVTFWAEAVNTACYVQNRVLVNKSQNKTPYELFNGRAPAIEFLKPFSCHVMILNTLDNQGKFEAKGDEGYFIRYSMSSKAFRVFNKRTRRIEENLHVEFLENKAIVQGAGPNWLFDIDSLTKSMNYMPVDAGTNSTNLSGTKDAANQEVNKPCKESSSQVPKGSGNPNSTTSTFNPSTEQMVTLTVESPIPTVSSPVPTACLNDSSKTSSEARLVLKRVANQEETPSLDNILSLTNRFDDILGVPTCSDEITGVEADISNMETSISASPTPTHRIHKDHPKSQIIGPVDTPIQTRVFRFYHEEQSFMATIHQKTDPALLQFCLYSCFLSQIEPKRVFDALQYPSWVEAMQEELLQFKIQKVWTLVDCPKGVRPIGTKWVLKNKKDERGIVVRNKARLVAQGHTQEEGIDYDEVFAPVARIEAIKLFLAYASFMGFTVFQMDVKSDFLYGTIDEEVYVMQPPGFHDPEYPAKVYKVEKAMYGLHQAPRACFSPFGDFGKFTLLVLGLCLLSFEGLGLIFWQDKPLNFDFGYNRLHFEIIAEKLASCSGFSCGFYSCAVIVRFLGDFCTFKHNPYLHEN